MVEGDQDLAPDLPHPLLIQTACLPGFVQAVDSRTTAYRRLVGSLRIAYESFRVWEETQDLAAVLRETVANALGAGHRSAEEIGAALSTLPDDSAIWTRYLRRLAAEAYNAERSPRSAVAVWESMMSGPLTNPLVREMKPLPMMLCLQWIFEGLWLCDTATIAGHLEFMFQRSGIELRISERQVLDEIRSLGLYRYEGEGRVTLAMRGPHPDERLKDEIRAAREKTPSVGAGNMASGKPGPERVTCEPE